jgi:cytochrome c1
MIKVLLAGLIGTVVGIAVMVIVIVVAGTDTSGASSVGLPSTAPVVSAPNTSTPSPGSGVGATGGGTGGGGTGGGGGGSAEGASLFQANGCGGCHTFKPAGSNGQQGPDLDNVASDAQKAGKPLDAYVTESIENPQAYVVPGYQPIMPDFSSLSSDQVAALVAYITQGK